MSDPYEDEDEDEVGSDEGWVCTSCGAYMSAESIPYSCPDCDADTLCDDCVIACHRCSYSTCTECAKECPRCTNVFCHRCMLKLDSRLARELGEPEIMCVDCGQQFAEEET